MTMRIAFVVGEFPKLSETFILGQIAGFLQRGHAVTIIAGRPGPEVFAHPDVGRYRMLERVRYWPELTGRRTGLLRLAGAALARGASIRRCRSVLRRAFVPRRASRGTAPSAAEHDAIIAHFGHVGLEALRLREAGALQGNLVTFFHAYDLSVFLKERGESVYERLFHHGDLFLPISRSWQQRLWELGCPPERTAVHPMGVDCARFSFHPRRPGPDGVTRLVTVARLVEKKGIAYALRALALVVPRYPALEYTIIGDGPLRGELENLIEELQLQAQVRIAGWMGQDALVDCLSRMHLFLAPSVTAGNGDVEGVPVALMEAMASGLPVLSTAHSGIPELVEDGVSGLLARERDVDALAENICRLLAAPAAWLAMAQAGRARVEKEFDIEKLNDRLVEKLMKLQASGTVKGSAEGSVFRR
ncbi:MAG: glycosyltransferase [Desulfobacterales bacterium]|jgi:colanic acid/amylovoran biosynthesis glycosyltransferase|nr:glycosyltransferase [Desulfobacterales bacterium]